MSTEIQDGSVRTLWRVSLPLIIAFLSGLGMLCVDRFFLARYSPEALGAAVSAGTLAWGMTFSGQTLTAVTTVFVARHNGAGDLRKIGSSVWQMLWASLFLILPCIAISIWAAPHLFKGSPIEESQVIYYRWMLGISPLFYLQGAINGFFIGRGDTKIITWLSLLGNLVNLILDPLLIFGWGPVPSLGMAGAVVATGLGIIVQLVIMLKIFLKQTSRKQFDTANWNLQPGLLWDGIRIGAPEAIAVFFEISAWGAFYCLMSDLGMTHLLVAAVGQSVLLLFFWFGIGLEHGTAGVAGNLMGAGKMQEISCLIRSGLKINGIFALCLMAILWVAGDWLIWSFLSSPESLESFEHTGRMKPEDIENAWTHLRMGLLVIGVYICVENIRSMLYGLLRAAGDTMFILLLSICSVGILLLLPTYYLMTVWEMPVITMFAIWLTFSITTAGVTTLRYLHGGWKERKLMTAG